MAKVPYIKEGGLRHLLEIAAISGEFPVGNVALLKFLYGAV